MVHHGVDHDRFRPRSGAAARPAAPYFLCIGNGKPYKNIHTALRACAMCVNDLPAVRLVIVGRGDSTSEFAALARRLGIADRVTLAGPASAEQMVDLLHGALALVFPSIVEGFGLPVLEAMAAGCPVIGSTCDTVAEIAADAALLCNPYEPAAFAAAMRRVAADSGLRDELRARGIARAAAFTWSRCAAETLRVYETVLGRDPARDVMTA